MALATAAVLLLPAGGAAADPAAQNAPWDAMVSAAETGGPGIGKPAKRAVERFKVVSWRDGRDRSRWAAVLIVRYPKPRRTLPATTRLTGKLSLELGRQFRKRSKWRGHVLVRARDVASVPVWRRGARPRAVHVLKFSAKQSRRLARHAAVRGWGARPPDWYAGISLTLAADDKAVAATSVQLSFNPIDWARDLWAKRDAACRDPLPPQGRWTGDDSSAYWACAINWLVLPVDQGVPAHLQGTYHGDFTSCSPRMRESRKTWELSVSRWDAQFTMYDYDVTRRRRFVLASLEMAARRFGRATTYEMHGTAWQTQDSWMRDLLPLTMSVEDSAQPEARFVKNCPYQ